MTHTFIPFIVSAVGLALGLAAMLFLILNVKHEMRQDRKRIEGMMQRLRDASREPPPSVPVILGSRMNINRRTRAVELLRAGEDAVRVAADLGIPRGEVELLVRVEEIVAHRMAKAAGE